MKIRAKKLGQHFLKNAAALKKIAAALDLQTGDTLIEIGAGRGVLTLPLAKACIGIGCRIISIEKDKSLIETLKNEVEINRNNVEIIAGDALKIIPQIISNWKLEIVPPRAGSRHPLSLEIGGGRNWKLIGNIPYYITGRLLRILSELENKPQLAVLTLQKEVAERIAARPPKMNLLAAITQCWAKPEIIQILKPEDFAPPPKVDSAIISLTRTNADPAQTDAEKYCQFIKILFKQPRKTIINNLRFGLKMTAEETLRILRKQGLAGTERPQNIGLLMLIKLASAFGEKNML